MVCHLQEGEYEPTIPNFARNGLEIEFGVYQIISYNMLYSNILLFAIL